MRGLDALLDPKTYAMISLAYHKALQRLPLTACMTTGVVVLTYSLIFNETFLDGEALYIMLFVVGVLTLTTSFALEYDTREELEALICHGVSPSDIFRLGILRMLTFALIGYFIGLLVAILIPASQLQNVKIFYSLLVSLAFGTVPPSYSAIKSLRISLLGRSAFRPLSDLEVPSLVYPSEADDLRSFLDEVLKDRSELMIIENSVLRNEYTELLVRCRYLGTSGGESSIFLASAGISLDKAFRDDETLPLLKARLRLRDGKCPLLTCSEVKKGRDIENTFLAKNLGALIRQSIIEYKVYKGSRRAEKL